MAHEELGFENGQPVPIEQPQVSGEAAPESDLDQLCEIFAALIEVSRNATDLGKYVLVLSTALKVRGAPRNKSELALWIPNMSARQARKEWPRIIQSLRPLRKYFGPRRRTSDE